MSVATWAAVKTCINIIIKFTWKLSFCSNWTESFFVAIVSWLEKLGHSTKKCVHGLHLLILHSLEWRHGILHVPSSCSSSSWSSNRCLFLLLILSGSPNRVIWLLVLFSSFRTTFGGISKVIAIAFCVFSPNCPGMDNIFHCNRIPASKDFINLIIKYRLSKIAPSLLSIPVLSFFITVDEILNLLHALLSCLVAS